MKNFHVYIMASKKNGTLYIGVTNNITQRVYAHKNKLIPGFTAQYSVIHLVYYEEYQSITVAIRREKQLKGWNRLRKLKLIESVKPHWKDFYNQDAAKDTTNTPGFLAGSE